MRVFTINLGRMSSLFSCAFSHQKPSDQEISMLTVSLLNGIQSIFNVTMISLNLVPFMNSATSFNWIQMQAFRDVQHAQLLEIPGFHTWLWHLVFFSELNITFSALTDWRSGSQGKACNFTGLLC